jgi:membrane associated rhomboid family serine protease
MKRAMRRGGSSFDDVLSFGGRVPPVVGGLIVALVAFSLLGVLGRADAFGAFVPDLVLRGEIWRLVTWPFFEQQPINLLFAGLTLYWFGRDLTYAWGPRRFLVTFFAITAVAAAVTTLASLVYAPLRGVPYLGTWATLSALIVAWASLFPERQILLFFALPVSGRTLLWITVGGTVLYAAFYGLLAFVPHLVAQGAMVLYLAGASPRGLFQSLRLRQMERRARRRASHLKVVHKNGGRRPGDGWLN